MAEYYPTRPQHFSSVWWTTLNGLRVVCEPGVVDYRILLVEAARPTLTASSGPWEHFSFKYFSFLWLFMIAVTYTVPVADLSSFASHCAFWLTTGCCGRVETCFPVYGVEG